MKNALLIMFTIGLLSCNNRGIENENGVEFDCKKIVGKYKLDVVEAVKENSSEDSKLINGLAAELLGGTISCDVNFYENGKGSMSFDAGWIGTLTDTKDKMIEFSYSLKNDSILVVNNRDLVIRTFSDHFDYLALIEKESGKKYIYNRVK